MSGVTGHADHGHEHSHHGHAHGHSHLLTAGLLSAKEKRAAGAQLALAMLSVGLLVLGLAWRWFSGAGSGMSQLLYGAASLVVAVPVVRAAWHSLRHPSLHGITDQLIALAMMAAWATGDLLTAALLPIVMIFGHILEERSVFGSKEAMDALTLLTRSKARRVDDDATISEIDNSLLAAGDVVEVRAGDRVPADGRVVSGQASLDTAPITGEAVPVDVEPGSAVFGGAINLDGLLRIEVTQVGDQSTLGKVIALMQRAEQSKPPITRLMERYAGQYLLLVLMLAGLAWFLTYNDQIMLAILVAACPCALVLSAPATAVAGIAVAARHGILIRGSAFLEELADVTSLIIDKTGTLTFGLLRLQEIRTTSSLDDAEVMKLAAALGSASTHPVSRALASLLPSNEWQTLQNVQELQGLGVVADTAAGKAVLGRPALFDRMEIALPPLPAHDGPIAGLGLNGTFTAWLLLADTIKPEAALAIAQLKTLGVTRQLLLTGDRQSVAAALASQVGIADIVAQALPEDKLNAVTAEIAAGFRPLVVGDGINDSLALKAGAVGVAMAGGGSDIALASADIILIGSDLRRLTTCIRLSRLCRTTLNVNIVLGLSWTIGIMAFAALGLLGPEGALFAAILHNISTLLVLINAGRLMRFEHPLSSEEIV